MTSNTSNKVSLSSKNNSYLNNVSNLLQMDHGVTSFEQSISYTPHTFTNNDCIKAPHCPLNEWFQFWKSSASRGGNGKSSSSNNSLKRKRTGSSQKDLSSTARPPRKIKYTPTNLRFVNGKEVVIPPEETECSSYDMDHSRNNGTRIGSLISLKSPRKQKPLLMHRNINVDDNSTPLPAVQQQLQHQQQGESLKTNRSKLRQLCGKNLIQNANTLDGVTKMEEKSHYYDPDYPEYDTSSNKLSIMRNKSLLETFCQEQRKILLLQKKNSLAKQQQQLIANRKRGRPKLTKSTTTATPIISSISDVITVRRKSNAAKRSVTTSSDLPVAPENDEEVPSSTIPIPAKSLAGRFPKTWFVEKRPSKIYYIRSPDGVEYHSLKDGLDGLKKHKSIQQDIKPEKIQKGATKKKRPFKSKIQQQQQRPLIQQHSDTPLTSLWLKHDSLKLLGSKPVWDDAFFIDENLKLLKYIMLKNRMNGDDEPDNAMLSSLLSLNATSEMNGIKTSNSNSNEPGGASVDDERRSARKKRNRTSNNLDGAACPTDFHAHALVTPKEYGEVCPPTFTAREIDPPPQPFEVIVHPDVPFIADLHAHCAKVEIIGLLGGKWVPSTNPNTNSKLYVQACLPCVAADDGSTDVEIDGVSMTTAQEALNAHGLIIVGWYHSHPSFHANPSSTDLLNQANFQSLFRDKKNKVTVANKNDFKDVVEPFVGLIIHPSSCNSSPEEQPQQQHYSQDEEDDNISVGHVNTTAKKNPRLFQSELTWFHLHRNASTFSHKSYILKNMGYMGVTLPEGQECVFAMALRTTMRIRKGSLLYELYDKEKTKLPSELQALDENDLLSKLQRIVEQDIQIRLHGVSSVCSSPHKSDISGEHHNQSADIKVVVEEDILPHLLQLRTKGYLCDRGVRKAEEAKLLLPYISNNDKKKIDDVPLLMQVLKSQILQSLKETEDVNEEKIHYIQELLTKGSNYSSSSCTVSSSALLSNLGKKTINCLVEVVKDRGTIKNHRDTKEFALSISVFCCELCGHTFDKKNEVIQFRDHLAEHEKRNEIPPLAYFESSMIGDFFNAMKKFATDGKVTVPTSVPIHNRFRGVYPVPGSLSFVTVLSSFDKTSEARGDVQPVGVYNSDVEAALAFDLQERAQNDCSNKDSAAVTAAAFLTALRHDHNNFNTNTLSEQQADENIFTISNDKSTSLKKLTTDNSFNFSSNGERYLNSDPHVIECRRLAKIKTSPYRGVTGDTCRWRAHNNNLNIGYFRTESEAARAINLLNIRLKGGSARMNHVPLSVSKAMAAKDGVEMRYMTRPLFNWDDKNHVSTFDFVTLQSKKDSLKLEHESNDYIDKKKKEISLEKKVAENHIAQNLESTNDSSQLQHLNHEQQLNNDETTIKLISKIVKTFNDAINEVNLRLGDLKVLSQMRVTNCINAESVQGTFNNTKHDSSIKFQQIESMIYTSGALRQLSSISISCNVCNEVVVNIDSLKAPLSESSKYCEHDYGISFDSSITASIVERIERHIVQPIHCLLVSILPPVSSLSTSNYSECNGNSSSDDLSFATKGITSKNVCDCLQPTLGSALSTGLLLNCYLKTQCRGDPFHLECFKGEYKRIDSCSKIGGPSTNRSRPKSCNICVSHEQKNGFIKLEPSQLVTKEQTVKKNKIDSTSCNAASSTFPPEDDSSLASSTNESYITYFGQLNFPLANPSNHMLPSTTPKSELSTNDMLPSIRCNPELTELCGIVSQIECIIKYYCIWPGSRRTDFLSSSSSSTIDYCDTMRLALAIHVSKMINFSDKALQGFDSLHDASLIDLVCRFVRFTWIISDDNN